MIPINSRQFGPLRAISLVEALLLLGAAAWATLFTGGAVRPVEAAGVVRYDTSSREVLETSPMTYTLYLPVLRRESPPPPTVFGVQMYGDLTSAQAGISLAQAGNVYWVRWPISWNSIEPANTTPGNYYYGPLDKSVTNVARQGLHLIATISDNPPWAANSAWGPIDKVNVAEVAEFVGALAERYDGDGVADAPGSPVVDRWEFYNEPDGDRYWGYHGAAYAKMLCAAYPAIHAANPQAKVVFGGIAYDLFSDTTGGAFIRAFLDDVLAAGGGNCFDVMNFHYYPAFEPVWAPYGAGMAGKAAYLRAKLQQYGVAAKPMVCTELGWFDDLGRSSPEIQASYVIKLYAQAMASHVDAGSWFSWIDPGWPYEQWGLLRQDLSTKRAYDAYVVAARKLGVVRFVQAFTASGAGYPVSEGYQFALLAGQGALYVFWSNDNATRSVAVPAARVTVRSIYDEIVAQLSDGDDGEADGYTRVPFGRDPVYVEANP